MEQWWLQIMQSESAGMTLIPNQFGPLNFPTMSQVGWDGGPGGYHLYIFGLQKRTATCTNQGVQYSTWVSKNVTGVAITNSDGSIYRTAHYYSAAWFFGFSGYCLGCKLNIAHD
jgi:hypothetical protein